MLFRFQTKHLPKFFQYRPVLKVLANQRDVPYQSLLKVFLADRVEAERRGSRRRAS